MPVTKEVRTCCGSENNNRTSSPLDTPQINTIDNSVSAQLLVRGGSVVNGRMYLADFRLPACFFKEKTPLNTSSPSPKTSSR